MSKVVTNLVRWKVALKALETFQGMDKRCPDIYWVASRKKPLDVWWMQKVLFRQNAFRAIEIGFANVHSFVRHEISSSNISKTFWARTTLFHRRIHTDIVYSRTGHDIIIYFRSKVIGETVDGFGWNFSRKRLQISPVKNIGRVFELSGVSFAYSST